MALGQILSSLYFLGLSKMASICSLPEQLFGVFEWNCDHLSWLKMSGTGLCSGRQ
jgi:hypothetical protein